MFAAAAPEPLSENASSRRSRKTIEQQDQQRRDDDGDSRREQSAEQGFGQRQAHQYCSTGTPIT